MKTTLSARNPIMLWLSLFALLIVITVAAAYFLIWKPYNEAQRRADQSLIVCRNHVNGEMWDAAKKSCADAMVNATGIQAAEARDLAQKAQDEWAAYHLHRAQSLLDAEEPALALAEIEAVFTENPGYPGVAEVRRAAQLALTPTVTSTPTQTFTPMPGVTPPTATLTHTPTATFTRTPSPTATQRPTSIDAPTVNVPATSTAQAARVATAVQATVEAQAAETQQARAVSATLTAHAPTPTPTPNHVATRSVQQTATALAQRAARTDAATATELARNVFPAEIEQLLRDWDRIHHEADYSLDGSELSYVLMEDALEEQRTTLKNLRAGDCYWIFTDLAPARVLDWERKSDREYVVEAFKHWDGKQYCKGKLTTGSFSEPFVVRYMIKRTDRWRIALKEPLPD